MDAMQVALPILGIVAAAAVTFYAVSFSEIREKSFRNFEDDSEESKGKFRSSASSRQRRAQRKADKEARK
ncbi:hypothetical protein ZOSMA_381G00100 [Zostera marina]|uniref:Transmembrane protein n=1 Tax=Zostera marina TaxID=29655 RepID=A0A0K9P536_ZOSMR|nr:hypothetical protein ZOSMA_381G00100 [Zostera marina]